MHKTSEGDRDFNIGAEAIGPECGKDFVLRAEKERAGNAEGYQEGRRGEQ